MTDELRDRLSRIADVAPSTRPDVAAFKRAARRRRTVRRSASVLAAFVVALALVLPLRELSGLGPGDAQDSASPSPAVSGYWIRFPDALTVTQDGVNASVEIQTNLPDGTRYQSQGLEGSCCAQVKEGVITVHAQNSSCYGLVGNTGNAPPYTERITVAPEYDVAFFGLAQPDTNLTRQPANVIEVLGKRFENLTGDQVQPLPNGAGKQLLASHTYAWPEPQCGGDPLPLFGGPDCPLGTQQLQGDNLDQAMTEVMGAITQARMCEFWQMDLTKEAAAAHPWDGFANEWRRWFLDPPKDFNPGDRNFGSWVDSPIGWELVRRDGSASIVEVTDHGTPILELRLEPLPDYCPVCSANTVPFWGVASWSFVG